MVDTLNETKFFKNTNISFCESFLKYTNSIATKKEEKNVLIFFSTDQLDEINIIDNINSPKLCLTNAKDYKKTLKNFKNFNLEILLMPFSINELFSKIKISLSKNEFLENSVFKFLEFTMDINKREIWLNEKKIKLTEREVNFLLYLKNSKNPVTIKDLLKTVWKYSFKTETHTVETHVHRLRKKFFQKFEKENIIKNDSRGYYI